jgi:hypothetical protein
VVVRRQVMEFCKSIVLALWHDVPLNCFRCRVKGRILPEQACLSAVSAINAGSPEL